MKLKRFAVFIYLFLAILIITSNFASASFFDRFWKKNPNLSPVNVGVGFANTPPYIVNIDPAPSPINGPYTAVAGGTGTFYVLFVAEDLNGKNDLPQGVNLLPSQAAAGISAPLSSVNPSITRTANNCLSIDCATGGPGGTQFASCTNTALQVAYACPGTFQHSDPPDTYSAASPNANQLWRISVGVTDIGGLGSPVVTSGDPGFTNLPNDFLRINPLSAYGLASGATSFNWNSLSVTGTNQIASAPVVLNNQGNVVLNTVVLTASNLLGTINPSSTLSASAFAASGNSGGTPPAQCSTPTTAIQLQNSIGVTIPGVNIPYTAAGSNVDTDSLYACIPTLTGAITGPPSLLYSGTWDLIAS